MTNPSEKVCLYRVKIVKRFSIQYREDRWQTRIFRSDEPTLLQISFESYSWKAAMNYGNELARIFNG